MGNSAGGCQRPRPCSSGYSSVPIEENKEACENGRPAEVSKAKYDSHIAAGRAMTRALAMSVGQCDVEKASVYGAAVAMPQFARTSGWSVHYTALAVRSYIFLFSNLILQSFFLYMLAKEERINDKFVGQMSLCNMGASMGSPQCPGGADCAGPGGTPYSAERFYDWETWNTRRFIRDALLAVFPERSHDINERVDPGEYGLESYWLRMCCHFIFVLGVWSDLTASLRLLNLLRHVPNTNAPWIQLSADSEDKDESDVRFVVAGMPLRWKAINLIVVLLPKLYIWLLMVDTGTLFLMETAEIEDMIVNAIALVFVLTIDEMIFETLLSDTAKQMLDMLEPLYLQAAVDQGKGKIAWDKHQADRKWSFRGLHLYRLIFPARMLGIFAIVTFFQLKYYYEHCVLEPSGSWVSKDIKQPLLDEMSVLSFILGPFPGLFLVGTNKTLWTMPT